MGYLKQPGCEPQFQFNILLTYHSSTCIVLSSDIINCSWVQNKSKYFQSLLSNKELSREGTCVILEYSFVAGISNLQPVCTLPALYFGMKPSGVSTSQNIQTFFFVCFWIILRIFFKGQKFTFKLPISAKVISLPILVTLSLVVSEDFKK